MKETDAYRKRPVALQEANKRDLLALQTDLHEANLLSTETCIGNLFAIAGDAWNGSVTGRVP